MSYYSPYSVAEFAWALALAVGAAAYLRYDAFGPGLSAAARKPRQPVCGPARSAAAKSTARTATKTASKTPSKTAAKKPKK